MLTARPLRVDAKWDPEAKVFTATSEDVPGLVTEAPTITRLDHKLRVMIPELLALNHGPVMDPAAGFVIHVSS